MLRKGMRVLLTLVGVAALAALALGVLVWNRVAGVDDWVIRSLVAIGETYIVPDIRFERSRFEPPGTVRFEEIALVAPDGTRVVEVGSMVVTLGELPQRGRPLVISAVELKDGDVRLLRDESAPVGRTMFKGLVPFVHTSAVKAPETVEPDVRLSRVLRLNRIRLANMGLEYAPGGGRPPMEFHGLDLDMEIQPREVEGRVVHTVDLNIDRGQLFGLAIKGGFSLDDLSGDFERIAMHIDVGEATYSALPPEVQAFLRERDATGRVSLGAAGRISVNDWRAANFSGDLDISRFNIAFGEYRLPIDSASIPLRIEKGLATMDPIAVSLLGGMVSAKATADLVATDAPAAVRWDAQDVSLREALRAGVKPGEIPKLAGKVRSNGRATAALRDMSGTLEGHGEVHVSEARLVVFALVKQLNQLILGGGMLGNKDGMNDRFDAFFDIRADRLDVTKLELHTPAIMARGDGAVHYDGRLDLALNAGPLEKIQSKLGEFGKILGQITDTLVTYRVRGVLGDPKVTVETLGF